MNDTIVARVAALKTASAAELKQMWRDLFQQDPPPFNRRFLETRLAYRIQELAYGGLKRESIKRLEKLGEQLDGGKNEVRRRRVDNRPVAGTRLDPRLAGRAPRSRRRRRPLRVPGPTLPVAVQHREAITGTNRNGWTFFGFASARGAG